MKTKEFYLKIDNWKSGCWLVWPVNRKQAEAWLHQKFTDDDSREIPHLDTADACTVCSCPPIIFLTKWNSSPEWIANLTHECIHVANHILEQRGVKEKEGCDEALAYLVGYLVESFMIALKKKR